MKNLLIVSVLSLNLAVGQANAEGSPRLIGFSGYNWWVKSSPGRVGPGPNYFSTSERNVRVDSLGRLHLKITKVKNRWYCAEIVSELSFGYGTYRFYLDSAVDNLDPNAVLGLFTWSDVPDFYNREIDIEFSRWANVANQNAQYVVQPYTLPENILRFDEPSGLAQSTHSFSWTPNQVFFQSLEGLNATPPDPSYVIQQWNFTGAVPPAGGENARMNLWLFKGQPPTHGLPLEVIINRFEFVPAP